MRSGGRLSFVRRVALRVLGLLALVGVAGPAQAQTAPREVRIGVLAYRGAEEADKSWQSTMDHLARVLPQYRFQMVTGTAPFLTAAVAAHRLDFVITNPGHYLELKIDYSAAALATEQEIDGPAPQEALGAAIFVPNANLEAQSLADLRGQKVAAVSPEAFGFRAASREFIERGVDPQKDLSLLFVGFPIDEIVTAVRSGRADAGVIRSCALEKLIAEGAVARDEFRVIGRRPSGALKCQVSTRLYAGWPFARVAQTDNVLARDVGQALLAMQPGADEKAWAPPGDYREVQELYRLLKVGPYAPFTRLGFLDLLYENRYLAGLFGLAILWWVAHVARVSYLVRQRTRELQQAHEATRLRAEQMEHTQRLSLMGEMASSLAHEINQPLAAILTYSRGCERRIAAGGDVAELADVVRKISVQAERAGDIVRRMKDFVRKNTAPQVPIDPSGALRDALALFEPTAAAAGATLITDVPDQLPQIRADRLQLEEIVLNLLQNALEALAGEADKTIRLAAHAEDGKLIVRVSDNGTGVPPDVQPRLFDPFYSTKANGLGLGLSLSRTIVEAHGGQLSLDASVAGETTFQFYVPLIEETCLVG